MRYSFDELTNPKDLISPEAAALIFGKDALAPALVCATEEEGEEFGGTFEVFNRKYHGDEPFVLHEDGFCRDFMATTLDGRRAAVTAIFVGDYYQDTDGNPTAYDVFIMD